MKKTTFYKILLLMVAIVWGGGFPATKIALDSGMEPNAIMCFRFFGAAIMIFIYLFFAKVKIKKSEMILGLSVGLVLGLAFSFQTIGLRYTTTSKNAFISGAYVVFVPFFLWLLTKERPKPIVYLSSLICFIGIGMLSLDGELGINYGDFLTLICAIFFGLQIGVIGAYIGDKNPIVINGFQMLSGGILTLIFNMYFENFSIATSPIIKVQVISVGFLIIGNTLFAYLVQTAAQKYVPSSTAALILSGEIVFAAILATIFFGETISAKAIFGGICIFSSVLLSESSIDLTKLWRNEQF